MFAGKMIQSAIAKAKNRNVNTGSLGTKKGANGATVLTGGRLIDSAGTTLKAVAVNVPQNPKTSGVHVYATSSLPSDVCTCRLPAWLWRLELRF